MASEACKKRTLEASKKPIAEPPKETVADQGNIGEPSQKLVKDKGKRKAGDALPRIPIAAKPQAHAMTSLRLTGEPKDTDVHPLKRKKTERTEGSLRTARPEVSLEAERLEVDSGAGRPKAGLEAKNPEDGLRAERLEAGSGAETSAPTMPAPIVRAFTNVLVGARKLLAKNLKIWDALPEGRPSRPLTIMPLETNPLSFEPLAIVPLFAVPLSANPTEVVHLSASNYDTRSFPDMERILRDLATKAPIIKPIVMVVPEQTESRGPFVILEASCGELNPSLWSPSLWPPSLLL